MTDLPSSPPPQPPPGPPPYAPPPPPPPAFQPPPGYANMPPPPVAAGQVPPAIYPPARASSAGIMYQFTGAAAWAILAGVATIAVPFVFGRVLFFLPILGILGGVQAIRTGRLIGGIIAIVLSCIGGIITLIALFA